MLLQSGGNFANRTGNDSRGDLIGAGDLRNQPSGAVELLERGLQGGAHQTCSMYMMAGASGS